MPEDRRHVLHLADRDVAVIERSLKTRHSVLGLLSDMRSSGELNAEADLLAHVSGIVQGHLHCDCAATPESRRLVPIEDRKTI